MPLSTNPSRADVLNDQAIMGTVSVGNSAVEAIVGGSRLTDRQEVVLYNASQKTVYWSPDSAVSTTVGIPLDPGEAVDIPFGDQIPVYLIAQSGNNTIIVLEAA